LPETKGSDGTLYSIEKLEKLIIDNKGETVEKIVETIENDINLFKGSQDLIDDQTLIVVKAE